MKKIILSLSIILVSLFSFAGDKEYKQTMTKNLQELHAVKNIADYLQIAKEFKMIAEKEKNQWLPYYYVSYSYLNYVFSGADKKTIDKILDKADAALEHARKLSPDNSEIEVLQGWIYQGRIQVDMAKRGYEYSEKASACFNKARKLNPGNPRIYFLIGQNVLNTPEQYGGGKEAACQYFIEAKEKYKSFKPATKLSPDWGMEYNNKLVATCNK